MNLRRNLWILKRCSSRQILLALQTVWFVVSLVAIFNYLIPWTNTSVFQKESIIPGEMGQPVKLLNITLEQQKLIQEGREKYGVNQYVSDLIDIRRNLPDYRHNWCKQPNLFNPKLQTSIIMTLYNEAWKTLLRSIHSVLDRSPQHLIKEIIIVDDYSDMYHLKGKFETYIKPYPKIKVMRTEERLGLVRARILGASIATAPILTFLDSHIEVTTGWLEPLLDRIEKNSTTVVSPIVDKIDVETWEYQLVYPTVTANGGFTWDLKFKWKELSPRELKTIHHPAEPIPSATTKGEIFAIQKDFFELLGMYDPEFHFRGTENLELSFKTWMCGGRLEFISCSRVGHVEHDRLHSVNKNEISEADENRDRSRLAEVWMDEYSKFVYQRIGKVDVGDISERKTVRINLNCKSFDWYLKNIYPEIFNPKGTLAAGEIRNDRMCLDAAHFPFQRPAGLWHCHGQRSNQFWWYTTTGEIRREYQCLDYFQEVIMTFPCHGNGENQIWKYDVTTQLVQHVSSHKCLTMTIFKKLTLEECREEFSQQWKFENYKP